jgi:hypothetical protein
MFAPLILMLAILSPQVPAMLLPDGNGAWTVHVTTAGGLVGDRDRDFALSSEGKIACGSDLRCPKDFRVPDFQPLIGTIQSTLPVPPIVVVSLCSDCIRRTITVRRRDSMGVVQTYTATWDETTRSQVPEEVIRVYDAITALMK